MIVGDEWRKVGIRKLLPVAVIALKPATVNGDDFNDPWYGPFGRRREPGPGQKKTAPRGGGAERCAKMQSVAVGV